MMGVGEEVVVGGLGLGFGWGWGEGVGAVAVGEAANPQKQLVFTADTIQAWGKYVSDFIFIWQRTRAGLLIPLSSARFVSTEQRVIS